MAKPTKNFHTYICMVGINSQFIYVCPSDWSFIFIIHISFNMLYWDTHRRFAFDLVDLF